MHLALVATAAAGLPGQLRDALDITDAATALAAEGHLVDPDDLATVSPLITRTVHRFGDWHLDLTPARGRRRHQAGPGRRSAVSHRTGVTPRWPG
ncbi:hypothetical protein GCM10010430_22120 [Kitasatospora cystarginea]|uniref:Uncharacterized protein n=1 Tax=Kitasatospora cystarginea TaxID=58350 RepID=A0ABP5QRC5_9ACTN